MHAMVTILGDTYACRPKSLLWLNYSAPGHLLMTLQYIHALQLVSSLICKAQVLTGGLLMLRVLA